MQCGYCYNYGHNKMGCPKAKERAATILPQWEQWQKMEHDNDYVKTSTYKAARHFEWEYKYREALDIHLQKQKRSTKVKVCNFCGQSGHNKRTCQELKDFKGEIKQATIAYRKTVINAISETGQGIGSMFTGEYSHWNRHKGEYDEGKQGIALVTGIKWHLINLVDVREHGEISLNRSVSEPIFEVRWTHGFVESHVPFVNYSIDNQSVLSVSWRGSDKKLLAPSKTVTPPDGWATCDDSLSQRHLSKVLSGRKSQRKNQLEYFRGKMNQWK